MDVLPCGIVDTREVEGKKGGCFDSGTQIRGCEFRTVRRVAEGKRGAPTPEVDGGKISTLQIKWRPSRTFLSHKSYGREVFAELVSSFLTQLLCRVIYGVARPPEISIRFHVLMARISPMATNVSHFFI